MISLEATLEPSVALQKLVESHLRNSLSLHSLLRAEKASLREIIEALADVPDEQQATLVGICMQRVAGTFIADP